MRLKLFFFCIITHLSTLVFSSEADYMGLESPYSGSSSRIRENFEKNKIENLTYDQGKEYLNFIRGHYPDLLSYIDRLRSYTDDSQCFNYDGVGYVSPTTLRYIKIAGDLRKEYGSRLNQMDIILIGDSGEFCKVVAEINGFATCSIMGSTLIDQLDIPNVHILQHFNSEQAADYDLLICLNPSLSGKFLDRVVEKASHGYVMCKSNPTQNEKVLTVDDLLIMLKDSRKKGRVMPDMPIINIDNQLLTWRPCKENSPSVLKKKVGLTLGKNDQKAVTYTFSGGRLGDNLVAYFHAKWVARENGWPFLYKPFQFSDLLSLHQMDSPVSAFTNYNNTWRITDKSQIAQVPPSSLVVIPYFGESKFEYDMLNHAREGMPFFVLDWDDPEFHKEVADCLKPTIPVETLPLPDGYVTVALHVRRGGAYEAYTDVSKGYPLKAPPDSYYISQIQRVAKIFKDQQLYVFIFTDDLNPQKMAESYANALQNPNIIFDWKPKKTMKDQNMQLLHDFYSMPKFDCFIRCMSNFSVMASKLGNYKVMVTPIHAYFDNAGQIVIDQLEMTFKDTQGE